MQKMVNPAVSGVEYQQGELLGYEVREYFLERWGRKCAYCGAKNVPLEIEHINPKIRGASNRVSNLSLACTPCSQTKGNQTADELGYPLVLSKAKRSLKDAAAVNATGHGRRQMCLRDRYGFPRTSPKQSSVVRGFSTGDIAYANLPSVKKTGVHRGRIIL